MGKKHRARGGGGGALADARVRSSLLRAEELAEAGTPGAALAVVADLVQQLPGREDVLERYLDYAREAQHFAACFDAAERLLQLRPTDPLLHLTAAGAAMALTQPFTTWHHAEAALACGLTGKNAQEVRAQLERLTAAGPALLESLHLEGPDARELALLHERVQLLLALGRHAETRAEAQRLLARRPGFGAALNNLGRAAWAQGDGAAAEAAWRQALEAQPGNVHALANLAQLAHLRGQQDVVRELVARMEASTAQGFEVEVKRAETHAFLGDDAAVLADAARAESLPPHSYTTHGLAVLHHFAAVAALRTGDEARARAGWTKALALDANLQDARLQLEALELNGTLRPLPWFLPLESVLPASVVQRVSARLEGAKERTGPEVTARLLAEVPELAQALRLLLDRGDPRGLGLALSFLWHCREPGLLEECRRFALGARGSIGVRIRAAFCLVRAGLATREGLELQVSRARMPLAWFDVVVHQEQEQRHGPQVEQLAERATLLLQEGQVEEAERLLEQALALEPESPDLRNNLALAHQLRGQRAQSVREVETIHTRWPDYAYARISVARLRAEAGKVDEARALLQPVLGLPRLHHTELRALVPAMVALHLAERDRDAAAVWVDMFAGLAPEDPLVPGLWKQVQRPGLLGKLLGR